MSERKDAKIKLVTGLSETLANSGDAEKMASTIVFNYSTIGVNDLRALRGKLLETGSTLKIVKNTLIKRIFETLGVTYDTELTGQNAILVRESGDFVASIKSLYAFMKEKEKGAIVLGILNNQPLTPQQVESLSKLPSRQELLGQVVGGFVTPIRSFVMASNGVQAKFVRTLGAIRDQKAS